MNTRVFYNDKMKNWFATVADQAVDYPEIDPFHTVFKFAPNVYSLYEENVKGGSAMWLHLIDGPEKALLVDTGAGIGDLKSLVKHLVGEKPLIVVNTHEHWDHILGNYQFDTVWCHPYAVPMMTLRYMNPHVWDTMVDEEGNGLNRKFKKSDFVDFKPYALMTCDDGHVFDLGGGYQVEVIYTPGHASGGLSFLDVQNRILFTGGMHSDNTFIFGGNTFFPYECTMEAFKDGLETLVEKHLHRFDRIFAGHEIVPLDASYVTEELQAVKDVLADPGCCEASWQNEAGRTVCRHMVGEAGIRYYLDTSFYRP